MNTQIVGLFWGTLFFLFTIVGIILANEFLFIVGLPLTLMFACISIATTSEQRTRRSS